MLPIPDNIKSWHHVAISAQTQNQKFITSMWQLHRLQGAEPHSMHRTHRKKYKNIQNKNLIFWIADLNTYINTYILKLKWAFTNFQEFLGKKIFFQYVFLLVLKNLR